MEQTTKSDTINYGLYLGAFTSLITVVVYGIDINLFTAPWLGIVLFIVVVAFGAISAIKSRKLLGGFISFKQAFSSYFITIAVGTLISSIVGIVIFNYIDPEAAIYLNEQVLILTKETMERIGLPQEAIIAAIEEASKKDNFSLGAQTQAFVFRLVFYAVIGLIVGLIIKKTDPKDA
jgi:hypothetical protein|tara:strand:+ start:127 stop:657 length:531 start_codon:yes stop_codon:yes gene_type:complete